MAVGARRRDSAGLLMYRRREGRLEVMLAHPGGPFYRRRDAGVWSIPKGELEPGEEPLAAALREFREETGIEPGPPYLPLGSIRQAGGKVVHAWAFERDLEPPDPPPCNTFRVEWPPRSGRLAEFPEIDRLRWLDPGAAAALVNPAQRELLDRLAGRIG